MVPSYTEHHPVHLTITPDGRLHPQRVIWPERCVTHIVIGEHLVAEYCVIRRYPDLWEAAATVHVTAGDEGHSDAWRLVNGTGISACMAVATLRQALIDLDAEVTALLVR
jgi:hypothetical protein